MGAPEQPPREAGGDGGGGGDDRGRRPKPPRGLRSRGVPRPDRRYSLLVGLIFAAVIVVAIVNGLSSEEGGVLGVDDTEGMPLPQFAVPTALGPLEGDANVAQDDCESSENPCPPGDRRVPACELEAGDVGPGTDPDDLIRVCDLFDKPLAISFWFQRMAECVPTQDGFDRVASRYRGRVNFLSINVRDDRDDVRRLIRERGWEVPVGYDADGAVSNIYGVGGCPTIAFAYPGGLLMEARVGAEELGVAELDAAVRRLLRASRRRAEAGR